MKATRASLVATSDNERYVNSACALRAVLIAAALTAVACSGKKAAVAVVDAGAPPAVVDAGKPVPAELSVQLTAIAPTGAPHMIDDAAAKPVVDPPPAGIKVVTNLPLRDYRIRVFDAADKVVPSKDTPAESADHLEYNIAFTKPLDPGSKYSLVIDSQSGGALTDGMGRHQSDFRREFMTSGEKPSAKKPGAAEKKPPAKKKKKK